MLWTALSSLTKYLFPLSHHLISVYHVSETVFSKRLRMTRIYIWHHMLMLFAHIWLWKHSRLCYCPSILQNLSSVLHTSLAPSSSCVIASSTLGPFPGSKDYVRLACPKPSFPTLHWCMLPLLLPATSGDFMHVSTHLTSGSHCLLFRCWESQLLNWLPHYFVLVKNSKTWTHTVIYKTLVVFLSIEGHIQLSRTLKIKIIDRVKSLM